ncbi:HNH endonuclease [Clostridioides difficile]|nr:HNH endonuclease [Clostridioides difficile]MBY2045613.1 HNH endonuclease [Clostridioides difficile]MBZ0725156.1 HNH endonuclease [Clostridioides difficile]MCA0506146.1 HNH endonuclease [Clostridioides difficile]MCA0541080.1 HNH endonuclease [Clostridioides difficile]
MPMKRICKCGKKIDYDKKMCEECYKRYNDANKKIYDYKKYNEKYNSEKRNNQEFYGSKKWRIAKDKARVRDKNLCRLCYDNKTIKKADLVHHIEEVKQCKDKIYDTNNLICLCERCHREVHLLYKSKASIIKEKLKDLAEEGF